MRRSPSTLGTVAIVAIFCGGCFPTGASGGSDGGTVVGFSSPTLELTVSGVHFGPMPPDPGAFVDLVTVRDGGGKPTQSSFRMSASIGTASCALAFDTFGTNSAAIGVGQYTVQSMQGASTLQGTVYPTTAEQIGTPEGPASCTGSTCDGAAFVLSALDASHATGYFMGTVSAASGAGVADVVCSFWLTPRTYTP
ncbi:MAG TPA: hypothetical protein VF945_21045 [Polyangia bacterium]